MKRISNFFTKLRICIVFLFSNNYVLVVMGKNDTYALARTESILHLDELNQIVELTLDDAETFYEYENQNQQ